MADQKAETVRAEIDHLRRLAQLVTDAKVRAEIEKMIGELEQRLRELEAYSPCELADGLGAPSLTPLTR